ncbi:MAG: serine/threonine-protein kinase [Myxococcota bacterium]
MSPLGEGSMGTVHLARHVALDRVVAIKLVSADFYAARADANARFHQEARLASRLHHKNAVQVLDFGHDVERGYYLVMEYVPGTTLDELRECDAGQMAPGRCIAIVSQVLAALADAHDAGIVHRDIKPSNIMLVAGVDDDGREREEVKVFDFGVATLRSDRCQPGEICGTAEYMSPEQAQGQPIDARSDIYAVGVLLYDLLSGQLPFCFDNVFETLRAQVATEPLPLRAHAPHVSEALAAVVARAMAKPRDERFPTARALRAALLATPEADALAAAERRTRLEAHERAAAMPDTRPAVARPMAVRAPTPSRSSRWLRIGAGTGIALAMLAVALAVFYALRLPVADTPTGRGLELAELARSRPRLSAVSVVPPEAARAVDASVVGGVRGAAGRGGADRRRDGARDARRDRDAPGARRASGGCRRAAGGSGARAELAPAPEPRRRRAARRRADGRGRARGRRRTAARQRRRRADGAGRAPAPAEAAAEPAAEPVEPAPAEPADRPADDPAPVSALVPESAAPVAPVAPPRRPRALASVDVLDLSVVGGLAPSSIARALAALEPAFERCYRAAVAGLDGDGVGSTAARVRIEIDVDSRVSRVAVAPLPISGLTPCVADALERLRVRERPDTGTAAATFHLKFSVRPR